jgi:hypothetical protein
MSDTAELIARVKQAAADFHLAAKLKNKPPLSAAFVFDDVVIALIAQAQEIERLREKILQYEINSRDRMHIIAVQRAEAAEARIKEIEGIGKRTQDDWPLCLRLALERGGLPAWLREFALMWDGHGHEIHCVRIKEAADAIEAAEARVRELEDTTMSVECLDAVRRDVEAATIERCAAIVGDHRVAARIRALAKEPTAAPSTPTTSS